MRRDWVPARPTGAKACRALQWQVRPGKGSAFVVLLPVPPDAVLPVTTPSVSAVALAFAHRRVLVADDNRDSAQTLALFLDLIGNRNVRIP